MVPKIFTSNQNSDKKANLRCGWKNTPKIRPPNIRIKSFQIPCQGHFHKHFRTKKLPPRISSKITFVVYHIYFQPPDGMQDWDNQNTPIIFAAVGIGIMFVLLIASRNSFQLNRTSSLTNYQKSQSDNFI